MSMVTPERQPNSICYNRGTARIVSREAHPSAIDHRRTIRLAMLAAALLFCEVAAQAQYQNPPDRYFPLNQGMPPGTVSRFQAAGGRIRASSQQAIEVQLPYAGQATFFAGSPDRPLTVATPAGYTVQVGQVYRFVIHGMKEFPGQRLFPTVEVIGELHPPPGQKHRFPIPLSFSVEEIKAAIDGQLVTKVVYLEQPQIAIPADANSPQMTSALRADQNLLAAADLRGRPMAIIRLGGRQPSMTQPDPQFFGALPFVQVSPVEKTPNASEPTTVEPVSFR